MDKTEAMGNEFKEYQHIERLGTSEVEGIEFGECYVFPKIDGTNSQLWWTTEDGIGRLHGGSRNRELSIDNDNQGFFNWCIREYGETLAIFFRANPTLRLYGEWLVPHTLKTYSEDAWRRFYVFDVMADDGTYLHYEKYKVLLDEYGIEYIPPICRIENPSKDDLIAMLEGNTYLIADGKGAGEGLVVKNYSYRNKYGRVTWAKVVRNEFRAKHAKVETTDKKAGKAVEQEIVGKFVTESLVEKEYAKIINETGGWSSKLIPRLLNTVYYSLIKEESWNFVKEFKHPTIDFKRLSGFTVVRVKELKPDLF